MTGNDITNFSFSIGNKNVEFTLGKKINNQLEGEEQKKYGSIFETIANLDGDETLSNEEFDLLKKLKAIFEKSGRNQDSNLDSQDLALLAEIAKADDIKEAINSKYKALDRDIIRELSEDKMPSLENVLKDFEENLKNRPQNNKLSDEDKPEELRKFLNSQPAVSLEKTDLLLDLMIRNMPIDRVNKDMNE